MAFLKYQQAAEINQGLPQCGSPLEALLSVPDNSCFYKAGSLLASSSLSNGIPSQTFFKAYHEIYYHTTAASDAFFLL
jgi:hypothetical protein